MPTTAARWLAGCLIGFLALFALGLLVRPLIFTLAPPRDDSRVVVATVPAVAGGPQEVPLVLSRSRGLDGERDAGDGRVQVSIIASQTDAGFAVVNAASPVEGDCPVTVAGPATLTDCAGRSWGLDGQPTDAADPPLQRFAVRVDGGALVADLTAPTAPDG